MTNEVSEITEIKKEVTVGQPKKEKGAIHKLTSLIKEVVAFLFWVYVLLKLFVFDLDIYLINKYLSNYSWLVNLKFFFIIGAIAIIWLFTKNKDILLWSLYILFYPVIILFWKLPFFVFKQKSWIFAFAFINAVISLFKSIKYNFITLSLFLVSFALIFNLKNEKILCFSIILILILLSIYYIHKFILVFKPSSIFQAYIKIFSATKRYGVKQTTLFALDENIKNIPVTSLDDKQLEKWTTNLQTSILFNRICLFAAKKLKDYQNSGLNIVSYVLTIILLIALTILSFAVINLGLFKINHSFFNYSEIPNFFTFFYYSFNNLIFNSVNELAPVSPIAQVSFMLESFFALILVAIFISLLLSVKSQRYADELNEAIKGIEAQGIEMEGFIREEYKINNIEDAMAELEKLKSSLAKFIFTITDYIK